MVGAEGRHEKLTERDGEERLHLGLAVEGRERPGRRDPEDGESAPVTTLVQKTVERSARGATPLDERCAEREVGEDQHEAGRRGPSRRPRTPPASAAARGSRRRPPGTAGGTPARRPSRRGHSRSSPSVSAPAPSEQLRPAGGGGGGAPLADAPRRASIASAARAPARPSQSGGVPSRRGSSR